LTDRFWSQLATVEAISAGGAVEGELHRLSQAYFGGFCLRHVVP